jgi:hypothetical protein
MTRGVNGPHSPAAQSPFEFVLPVQQDADQRVRFFFPNFRGRGGHFYRLLRLPGPLDNDERLSVVAAKCVLVGILRLAFRTPLHNQTCLEFVTPGQRES